VNGSGVTREPVAVDLALQGGGSHGAFTWGVLDRLLEEPWLRIVAISGTDAADGRAPGRERFPRGPRRRCGQAVDRRFGRAAGGVLIGSAGVLLELGLPFWAPLPRLEYAAAYASRHTRCCAVRAEPLLARLSAGRPFPMGSSRCSRREGAGARERVNPDPRHRTRIRGGDGCSPTMARRRKIAGGAPSERRKGPNGLGRNPAVGLTFPACPSESHSGVDLTAKERLNAGRPRKAPTPRCSRP
jgi:hypothetical protein